VAYYLHIMQIYFLKHIRQSIEFTYEYIIDPSHTEALFILFSE